GSLCNRAVYVILQSLAAVVLRVSSGWDWRSCGGCDFRDRSGRGGFDGLASSGRQRIAAEASEVRLAYAGKPLRLSASCPYGHAHMVRRMWWHPLNGNGCDPRDDQDRQQHGAIVAPLWRTQDRCALYS